MHKHNIVTISFTELEAMELEFQHIDQAIGPCRVLWMSDVSALPL
jgi:hypothetical protein